MYKDEWNRFMQTGQVSDYLAYKEQLDMEDAANKSGETHERGYAGFRSIYGDCNKVGANRRI